MVFYVRFVLELSYTIDRFLVNSIVTFDWVSVYLFLNSDQVAEEGSKVIVTPKLLLTASNPRFYRFRYEETVHS